MADSDDAAYVFGVTFELPAGDGDGPPLQWSPSEFETTVEWPAAEPGEPGWLFFRDHLWRGAVSDESHLRGVFSERLGVPVTAVSFRELRAGQAYLDALESAIVADLDRFNAASARDVRHKYLGSSVRVV
jgi:hypothetical protein